MSGDGNGMEWNGNRMEWNRNGIEFRAFLAHAVIRIHMPKLCSIFGWQDLAMGRDQLSEYM